MVVTIILTDTSSLVSLAKNLLHSIHGKSTEEEKREESPLDNIQDVIHNMDKICMTPKANLGLRVTIPEFVMQTEYARLGVATNKCF